MRLTNTAFIYVSNGSTQMTGGDLYMSNSSSILNEGGSFIVTQSAGILTTTGTTVVTTNGSSVGFVFLNSCAVNPAATDLTISGGILTFGKLGVGLSLPVSSAVITIPNGAICAAFRYAAASLFVEFTDESYADGTHGSLAAWDWNFGDGSPHSNLQSPTHTYASGGTYAVQLIAYTASDFSSTCTIDIVIS